MNVTKYIKLYLEENWGNNKFIKLTQKFTEKLFEEKKTRTIDFQMKHPLVISGQAFWIKHNELCIGYVLSSNNNIFRPVFSHKRQKILNKVNLNIINPINYWNKIKSKYFLVLCKKNNIPIECIKYIISFIYK